MEDDIRRISGEGEPAGAGGDGAPERESKRVWTPNRQRNVRSKKSFDRKKVEHVMKDDAPAYKGELDPRQKDDSMKGKTVRTKVAVPSSARTAARSIVREDGTTDFRAAYERNDASPGRLAALYATQQVRRRRAFAQEVIEQTIDRSHLSPEDRAFATLLTLGVVSTWGALDEVLNRCLASPRDIKPDVRDAMRISTYEIIFLRKAPHAALDQGVELVRAVAPSASGLANAVLHRVFESAPDFPFGDPNTSIDALALACAFPTWLAKQLLQDLGPQAGAQLMRASNERAPLFIAVNPMRATDEEVLQLIADMGAEAQPAGAGGLTPPGCYRVSSSRLLADGRMQRMFQQGKLVVSDAAAQAVALAVLEGGEPESLLEVGAGRGTKAILLQGMAQRQFGRQLDYTPLDSHAFKSDVLRDRLKLYGAESNAPVTGNALRLDSLVGDRSFHTVFVDAPCSGLGTLRRHHEIRWRITPEQIGELAATQLALLRAAAGHVQPGGALVYSTCTVTYAENNGTVKAFLESPEGADFRLSPINGKACFASQLSQDSPDAHFSARFVRVE